MLQIFSQLHNNTNGNVLSEFYFERLLDVVTLNSSLFPHRFVWIKEEESYYYYIGNGTTNVISNWKKFRNATTTKINEHISIPYEKGTLVWKSGILYYAADDINNVDTPGNSAKWIAIGANNGNPIASESYLISKTLAVNEVSKNISRLANITGASITDSESVYIIGHNLIAKGGFYIQAYRYNIESKRFDLPIELSYKIYSSFEIIVNFPGTKLISDILIQFMAIPTDIKKF